MRFLRSTLAAVLAATTVGVVPGVLVAQQLYECTTTTRITTVRETLNDGTVLITTVEVTQTICIML
jgi:hypothetical protein